MFCITKLQNRLPSYSGVTKTGSPMFISRMNDSHLACGSSRLLPLRAVGKISPSRRFLRAQNSSSRK